MRLKGKIILGVVLWSVMMLGMVCTARAYDNNPYASLVLDMRGKYSSDKDKSILAEKMVNFGSHQWYIIKDDSRSATEGTLTLFITEDLGSGIYGAPGSKYSSSAVRSYYKVHLGRGRDRIKNVFEAIKPVTVTTTYYSNGRLETDITDGTDLFFLLDKETAENLPEAVRRMYFCSYRENWVICSPGSSEDTISYVNVESGKFSSGSVNTAYLYRPALQLDLSKVVFDSEKKEFTLPVDSVTLTSSTNNLTMDGEPATLTTTVSPAGADQTVKWDVSGTAGVTLYEDAECKTAITLNSPTDILKVYAKGIAEGNATITVTSDEGKNISKSCTVTVDPAHTHDGITFQTWASADSLPDKPGNYYLTKDVTLNDIWKVPSGGVNLCLNGHGIVMAEKHCVVGVQEDVTLNVYDCGRNEHRYTITNGLATVNDELTERYLTFTGGYITGGASPMAGTSGCGIYIDSGGKVTLNGGAIIGNAGDSYGGGIYNRGSFTMNGGAILGNTSNGYGGGLFNSSMGTFNMKGGTISRNTCIYDGGIYYPYGGGVLNDGVFTMSDGEISRNACMYGGGIANNGNFTMSGGKISENTAESGGGIMACDNKNTTIKGGSVIDNTSTGERPDGGIEIGLDVTFKLSGSPTISGNKNTYNGTERGANIYLKADSNGETTKITIDSQLTNTTSIGIWMQAPGVFTKSAAPVKASDYKERFTSEDADYIIQTDGDELKLISLADVAKNLINAIPGDPTTTEGRKAVSAARKAYDDLTEDQKDQIPQSVLKKLTDAEETIAQADAAADLAEKKTTAIGNLETYRDEKEGTGGSAVYDTDGLTALDSAVSTGTTNINKATTAAEVETALSDARAAIDAVKTIAQKAEEALLQAKVNAKTALASYKDLNDYRAAQQKELKAAISDGREAIDAATTEDGVSAALAAAKAEIDKIKTDAQLTREESEAAATALETAKENATNVLGAISLSDYREEKRQGQEKTDRELVNEILTKAAGDIAAAQTPEAVAGILEGVANDIAGIPTAKELFDAEREALDTAKTGALAAIESIMADVEGKLLDSERTDAQIAANSAKIAVLTAETPEAAAQAADDLAVLINGLKDNKAAADQKAGAASDLIDDIPADPSADGYKAKVTAASAAYAALNDEEKSLVPSDKVAALEAAELEVAKADAKADMNDAIGKIDTSKYDEEGKAAISKAKTDGETAINNAGTAEELAAALQNARDAIDAVKTIDEKKAEEVNSLIDAIPADITSQEGKAALSAASQAYDKLTDDQKALVGSAEQKLLDTVKAAISAVEDAKTEQAKAEAAQKVAEAARAAAEAARAKAEAAQKVAEAARAAAEAARAKAEAARAKAEAARAKAEAARKIAENARTAAQAAQKTAEFKEAAAVAAKKAAEKAAKESGASAEAAIQAQAKAEAAQKEAEEARQAADEAKEISDAKATAAEAAQRIAEEAAKAAKEAQAKAEADKDAAEEKADNAEKVQKEAEEKAKIAEEEAKAAQADMNKAKEAAKAAQDKEKEAQQNTLTPLAKTKNVKVKGGKRKATVRWKAVDGAKGYEIIISRNKKGTKKVKTVKAKGTKKTIKKLKKGKYYIKVRAWKKFKGNTVYGKYSKAKRVKVK